MNYQEFVMMMRRAGLIDPYRSPSQMLGNLNKVAHHGDSKNETDVTFMAKAMLCKVIHDNHDFYVSEFRIRNRKIDVFQAIKGDFIKYEFATNPTLELAKDQSKTIPGTEVVIDTRKIPSDIYKMRKYIEQSAMLSG